MKSLLNVAMILLILGCRPTLQITLSIPEDVSTKQTYFDNDNQYNDPLIDNLFFQNLAEYDPSKQSLMISAVNKCCGTVTSIYLDSASSDTLIVLRGKILDSEKQNSIDIVMEIPPFNRSEVSIEKIENDYYKIGFVGSEPNTISEFKIRNFEIENKDGCLISVIVPT